MCGINPYGYFRNTRRFVAELDDQIVGEGWTVDSRHNPWSKLAHYGMFSDEHKRKGLGSRLLDLCIEAVRHGGMEAFFVDTGPSIAHMVYEKHGIHDVVPDHPEWLALSCDGRPIQDYLRDYFAAEQQELQIAPLDFSHLIEIQALLNAAVEPAFLVKNYLLTLFADDQLHEGQITVELPALAGAKRPLSIPMLGLLDGPRLVGFSTLAPWRTTQWDNKHESHIGLWDLYFHPPFWSRDRCALLFETIRDLAAEKNIYCLRVVDTPRQTAKTEMLQALGFQLSFVMPRAVLVGEGTPVRGRYPGYRFEDLGVYEIQLGAPQSFAHPYRAPWDY